jgi:hypothetical protein
MIFQKPRSDDRSGSHAPWNVPPSLIADPVPQVIVRSQWNAWRAATVPVTELEDIHWLRPNGAPRRLLHGYVWCNRARAGQLPHDCPVAPAPHRVLVCVLERDTVASVFGQLSMRATERAVP